MSTITETAKDICIKKLLIPFEGEGTKTKDGKFLAYKDPGSVSGLPITIAWGLTYHADGTPIKLGEEWDFNYAVSVKKKVLDNFLTEIIKLCPCLLNENPNKLASILSFVYNVGIGNFKKSTLMKKVNLKLWGECPTEFNKWTNAGGKKMNGLVRRRKEEAALFISKI